jgi:hypothetical protein
VVWDRKEGKSCSTDSFLCAHLQRHPVVQHVWARQALKDTTIRPNHVCPKQTVRKWMCTLTPCIAIAKGHLQLFFVLTHWTSLCSPKCKIATTTEQVHMCNKPEHSNDFAQIDKHVGNCLWVLTCLQLKACKSSLRVQATWCQLELAWQTVHANLLHCNCIKRQGHMCNIPEHSNDFAHIDKHAGNWLCGVLTCLQLKACESAWCANNMMSIGTWLAHSACKHVALQLHQKHVHVDYHIYNVSHVLGLKLVVLL